MKSKNLFYIVTIFTIFSCQGMNKNDIKPLTESEFKWDDDNEGDENNNAKASIAYAPPQENKSEQSFEENCKDLMILQMRPHFDTCNHEDLEIALNEMKIQDLDNHIKIKNILLKTQVGIKKQLLVVTRALENKELRDALKLRTLKLRGNLLQSIPDLTMFKNSLQRINLNNNQFEEFPQQLLQLENLQLLWIGNNFIKTIPDSINNLKNLKNLVLRGNPITSLPENLSEIPLIRVYVSDKDATPEITKLYKQLESKHKTSISRHSPASDENL